MDATPVIAVYAALVATGALLIQLAQWRNSRTQLGVRANAGTAPVLSEREDAFGNKVEEDGEVIFVTITNRSPHSIKVTHVGMVTAVRKDSTGLAFTRPYPRQLALPFEIPARDHVTLWQPRNGLEDWDETEMRIRIGTAAGDDFYSRRFRFADLAQLEIRS